MGGTNVKAFGFEISLSENILFEEFFHEIVRNEDTEIRIGDVRNVYYVDVKENYIVGVVIVIRDDRKSIASSRDDDGNLIIKKDELSEDENSTEISLFCINPLSKKGLLLTYSKSISVVGLYRLFKPIHGKLKKEKIKEKAKELSNLGEKKSKVESAKNYFGGIFQIMAMKSFSDIDAVLKSFSELKEVEFRVTESMSIAPMFSPIKPFVENSSYKFRLSNKMLANNLKSTAAQFANYNKARALKIFGKGLDGEYLGMLLGENTEEFFKIKYDRYVELLPDGKIKDYCDCSATNNLIGLMKGKTEIFGTIPHDDGWMMVVTRILKGYL